MSSAIIYSKKLRGEVNARACVDTGNIALFAALLSMKPCKLENIHFDDTAEKLIAYAEQLGVIGEKTSNSISLKGFSEPERVFYLVTDGLFDDFDEIPHELCGGEYFLRSDVPVNVLIGLMMGLALAKEDSHIVLTNVPDGIKTIELAIHVLGKFGIFIDVANEGTDYHIAGDRRYSADLFTNECDWEQAAFYLLADALGADIKVNGLHEKTKQTGVLMLNPLRRMGARFTDTDEGMIATIGSDGLFAAPCDALECPGMLPVIMAAGVVADGVTVINNIDALDAESYENAAHMRNELVRLGANVAINDGKIFIGGKKRIRGGARVTGDGDMVTSMALLALAVVCEKALILNELDWIDEKYPGFTENYKQLGGCIGNFGR